jgi:hypothetical protein
LYLPVKSLCFVAVGFVAFILGSANATEPGRFEVHFANRTPVQQFALNGPWLFHPNLGKLTPQDVRPEAIDAEAKSVSCSKGPWYPVEVPQFLNRIEWWLPNVSLEYENQETARVQAFPFDAAKTQSGWYLLELSLPSLTSPDRPEVHLNFEGIAMISRVYCNGHFVGGHVGMFDAIDCRLTPYLGWGKENTILVNVQRGIEAKDAGKTLAVAVTMVVSQDMLTSLDTGLFGGFGRGPKKDPMGIWQPVTLKFSHAGGRINDVFFNPSLDGHHIEVTLQNPDSASLSGKLSYSINDTVTKLELAADTISPIRLRPGESKCVEVDKSGLRPRLWAPDDPNLYDLTIQWKSPQGKVIDEWRHHVGYRTVQVKGTELYLNGKPYWARGADMPPYGYRPDNEATARGFLKMMHDGNTVITRSHGNPLNEMWFDAADQIGVGISVEGVRPWALMTKEPPPPDSVLAHWSEEQFASVRQYRNHPSALLYTISNEGLQDDYKNPAKLAIFRKLIDGIRKIDPSRPIIQTSGDPDEAHQADIEDVHAYWGWYESSSFVNDYTKPRNGLHHHDGRPFINEECAVPYQMIDTGACLSRYIDLYSPQPWVGDIGVDGTDSAFFSEHVRAEAKLKAEKLRYSRKVLPTAGMMLFTNLTWIQGALSRPPSEWKPLPVWDAVRQAYQPVLAALETTQSVFFAGDPVNTNLYVVNDDTRFRNLTKLSLSFEVLAVDGHPLLSQHQQLGDVPYYDVRRYPLSFTIPGNSTNGITQATLRLRLTDGDGTSVSENTYPIRIASHAWTTRVHKHLTIAALGCNTAIQSHLASVSSVVPLARANRNADVVVVGPGAPVVSESLLRAALRPGGRVLLLENATAETTLCADALAKDDSPHKLVGEFVEMLGWRQQKPLYDGLAAMDWKWWTRGNAQPAFACSAAHRLDLTNPNVEPIGRFLEPHFYWSGDLKKVYESKIAYPVFAVHHDWADLIVCDLTLSDAIAFDPRAAKTLTNLLLQPL